MPSDQFALPEIEPAEQIAASDPLPAAAGEIAEDLLIGQQLRYVNAAFSEFERGFQSVKRGCARECINAWGEAKNDIDLFEQWHLQPDTRPLRHQCREGDDAHGKGDHRRVEWILAKAAIKVLGNNNGEKSAGKCQPPRGQRREGEGDQPGSDDGRAVRQKNAQWLVLNTQHDCFGKQRGQGGNDQLRQYGGADQPDIGNNAGNQGDADLNHHLADAGVLEQVGGCGETHALFSSTAVGAAG